VRAYVTGVIYPQPIPGGAPGARGNGAHEPLADPGRVLNNAGINGTRKPTVHSGRWHHGFMIHRVGDVELEVSVTGAGYPVLLLHGFPQTHLAWRHVAANLAEDHLVVCPDLPGYGASSKPAGQEHYAKRTTAATMITLMRSLGHSKFALIGHDRGALVAFRAALDHPDVVERVGVIDVIPTLDLWDSLTGIGGVFAFHLYLLAQPTDIAERMISADPDTFHGYFLDAWTPDPAAIPPDIRATYLAAARDPAAIRAVCDDYRASAFIDATHDQADRAAGRRIEVPALAIWQDPGDRQLPFDPEAIWRSWMPNLSTRVLPGGHFLPETQPQEVASAIRQLLRRSQ
jgi:pimeloyl-ACP methyl ester carboxylesterase